MNLLMIIRVAFRALVRNKMRAALTMLGIIIGVSAVIAMVSIGQGASASVQAQIESIGTNLLFVSAGAQNVGGVRSGTGDTGTNTLTVEDLDAIKREVPSVSMVTPSVNARSQLVAGNMNWNTAVTGVSEQYPEIRKWPVASGSFFTDADVRTAARVIVIGQTLADNLFPGTDPIGQDIRVMNLPFRIVGVMARKGQDPQGRDQDDVAFAPYTTVQKKILGRDRVQIAYVSAISQDATYTAQSQITDLLRQRHKLTANEPNDFTVRNMTDIAEAANETSKTMTILLACIAGVSLLVGGIGIMNIMLVSVTERTREIGIRMAIGARSSAVRSQFLIESIVLSLTGGTIGIILGVVLSLAIPAMLGWPTLVSMMAIVGSVIFSAAVGSSSATTRRAKPRRWIRSKRCATSKPQKLGPPRSTRSTKILVELFVTFVLLCGFGYHAAHESATRLPANTRFFSCPGPGGGYLRPATASARHHQPKRPRLVLLIVVDQFRYDYLERFGDLLPQTACDGCCARCVVDAIQLRSHADLHGAGSRHDDDRRLSC